MLHILLLAVCVKLLIETERPLLCAALYTGTGLMLGLLFSLGGEIAPLTLLVAAGMRFAFASIYFLLLDRIGDGALWWVVLVLGLAIGLV